MKTYTGRLIDGQTVAVEVDGATIRQVRPVPDDASLPWLLPVLVDLQHNGALGTAYGTVGTAPKGELRRIGEFLLRQGVGRCLLTLATYPVAVLQESCKAIRAALEADPVLDRLYCGVFHEGLFISPEAGWRGAHNLNWILPPDYSLIATFDELLGGRIAMVNIAPELTGSDDFIAATIQAGKRVSLGHCNPTPDQIEAAVELGASLVTHLGNGAAPEIHRFRNPFWRFLTDDRLAAGVILDGHHLPADFVRTVFRCKDRKHIFPISDASGYSGYHPGSYRDSAERDLVIETNGFLHLKGSEILCGAWHQLPRAVEFLVQELNLSFPSAWRQCSLVPAEIAGLELPTVEVGQEASFVVASWDGHLHIEESVHGGVSYQPIHRYCQKFYEKI